MPHLSTLNMAVTSRCQVCAKYNPKNSLALAPGIQRTGTSPFEDLVIDFTKVKPCQGSEYLLVTVCTFSGWVEAFPTGTEQAREVVKALLREILP